MEVLLSKLLNTLRFPYFRVPNNTFFWSVFALQGLREHVRWIRRARKPHGSYLEPKPFEKSSKNVTLGVGVEPRLVERYPKTSFF